jgi:hypothetical protein
MHQLLLAESGEEIRVGGVVQTVDLIDQFAFFMVRAPLEATRPYGPDTNPFRHPFIGERSVAS